MDRTFLPLILLKQEDSEPIEGITRFMKLVFLAQEEGLDDDLYEFEAAQYGPFSKSLYSHIDSLVEEKYISEEQEEIRPGEYKQIYRITDKGKETLRNAQDSDELDLTDSESLRQIKSKRNSEDLWDLLEYVYWEYPQMAKNSVLDIPVGPTENN